MWEDLPSSKSILGTRWGCHPKPFRLKPLVVLPVLLAPYCFSTDDGLRVADGGYLAYEETGPFDPEG
jgi:hypothetical protein